MIGHDEEDRDAAVLRARRIIELMFDEHGIASGRFFVERGVATAGTSVPQVSFSPHFWWCPNE